MEGVSCVRRTRNIRITRVRECFAAIVRRRDCAVSHRHVVGDEKSKEADGRSTKEVGGRDTECFYSTRVVQQVVEPVAGACARMSSQHCMCSVGGAPT